MTVRFSPVARRDRWRRFAAAAPIDRIEILLQVARDRRPRAIGWRRHYAAMIVDVMKRELLHRGYYDSEAGRQAWFHQWADDIPPWAIPGLHSNLTEEPDVSFHWMTWIDSNGYPIDAVFHSESQLDAEGIWREDVWYHLWRLVDPRRPEYLGVYNGLTAARRATGMLS